MIKYKYPVVLTIAGSDSSGGAGVQADLKTISALGCFGATAITAVTVQNTMGVYGIHAIPVDVVKAQITAVMDDLKPSAIKIGMIYNAEQVSGIADILNDYPKVPVILDPVMVATSGDQLMTDGTVKTLKKCLFPLSTLVTPNLDEAAILAGMEINTVGDMKKVAMRILQYDCNAVLIKGGHLKGPDLFDFYMEKDGTEQTFASTAIDTVNSHGTGCTLSSAVASFAALKNDLNISISYSKKYIQQALELGKDVSIGKGHGPLNHFFDPQKLVKHEIE